MLSFAQTGLLCGVRGVSERVAMGIDLRQSKIISGGYQTRICMHKPTILQVLESFMHYTLHRLTSGEPECDRLALCWFELSTKDEEGTA